MQGYSLRSPIPSIIRSLHFAILLQSWLNNRNYVAFLCLLRYTDKEYPLSISQLRRLILPTNNLMARYPGRTLNRGIRVMFQNLRLTEQPYTMPPMSISYCLVDQLARDTVKNCAILSYPFSSFGIPKSANDVTANHTLTL